MTPEDRANRQWLQNLVRDTQRAVWQDYPRVRYSEVCVRCNDRKEPGLVLCWPCHRSEKTANEGGYSGGIEQRLQEQEARLLLMEGV